MNKHAVRGLVAAAATSVALIAVGSASAQVVAAPTARGADITPWQTTHGGISAR
jgi:hypothetical protein